MVKLSVCCGAEFNEEFKGICDECGLPAIFIRKDCNECVSEEKGYCNDHEEPCNDVKDCIYWEA